MEQIILALSRDVQSIHPNVHSFHETLSHENIVTLTYKTYKISENKSKCL